MVQIQVPPAYLLRHAINLDQRLFPPRPAERPLGRLENKYVFFFHTYIVLICDVWG